MNVLSFVPRARPEESPRSLLIRTAYHNGFKSVAKMIASLQGENNARPFDWQLDHSSMANLFEELDTKKPTVLPFYRSTSKITRGAPVYINHIAVPLTLLKMKKHRICPECISEGWQRYIQDFDIIDACPYHDCSYIDHCPSCEQQITWTDCNGALCKCGFDLRNTPKQPKHSQLSTRLLSIFRSGDQESFDSFLINLQALRYHYKTNEKEKKDAADLALTIATSPNLDNITAAIYRSMSEHESAPTLFFVAPWLLSNSEDVRQIASSLIVKPLTQFKTPQDCKPEQTLWLRRDELAAIGITQFSLQALIQSGLIIKVKIKTNTPFQYYSHSWAAVEAWLESSGTQKIATETLSHFDVERVALDLDVYPEVVRRAVKAGFMAHNSKKGAFGKMLLDANEVSAFNNRYIFVGPLAKQLDTPNTTLTARLTTVGIIPVSGPTVDGGLVAIYERRTLDELRVTRALEAETYSNKAGRRLHKLMPNDTHISSTETARILGVENQRLKYLERMGFLVQEIPAQFLCENRRFFTTKSVTSTKRQLDRCITIDTLSRELEIPSVTFARRFIKSGYASPIVIGKRQLIGERDAGKIRDNVELYCSCDQADKYLKAPIGHASNLISTGRIQIVPASKSGIGTVRLISWADIKSLAGAL
jgi:hypothetical protein